MSNFSNIGFDVTTQEDFEQLLDKAYEKSQQINVDKGHYSVYTDNSGAELFIQFNRKNEYIGLNPHFKGKSKRNVCLTNIIERNESELDGAFHCWAEATEENNPESGVYPFVFDMPDFETIDEINFPKSYDIQLTAFAQELSIYDSEQDYHDSQTSEPSYATQSFIPSGLFSFEEENKPNSPQALGIFTGIIKEFERKRNELTNEEFFWLLIDTLGGEVDVVADIRFFENEPKHNGVIQGQFWLSGQLINPPIKKIKEQKSFLQKLFKR